MAHPVRPDEYVEINNFYTTRSTRRAPRSSACSTRCSGPSASVAAWTSTSQRHDGQAVTCDDFVQAMQDAAPDGGPTSRSSGAGTRRPARPVVRRRGRYDAGAATYTLDVAQHCPPTPGQPAKAPFHIPLAVGLVGPDGRDLPLDAGPATRAPRRRRPACSHVTAAAQSFRFDDVAGAAGAVAAARLLRARARWSSTTARDAGVARRARQRSVQPLGRGAAQLRRRDPGCRARSAQRRPLALRSSVPAPSRGSSWPTRQRPGAARAGARAARIRVPRRRWSTTIDVDALAAAAPVRDGELARALRERVRRALRARRAPRPYAPTPGAGRRARARQPLPRATCAPPTTRRRVRSPSPSTTRPTT